MNALESQSGMSLAQVIGHWLEIYASIYREEMDEPAVMGFRVGLQGLKHPQMLHEAFLRAMQRSKWRPNPAEVIAQYETVLEKKPPARPQLVAPAIPLTPEEKKACEEYSAEFRKTFGQIPEALRNLDGTHTPQCLCRKCRRRRNAQHS